MIIGASSLGKHCNGVILSRPYSTRRRITIASRSCHWLRSIAKESSLLQQAYQVREKGILDATCNQKIEPHVPSCMLLQSLSWRPQTSKVDLDGSGGRCIPMAFPCPRAGGFGGLSPMPLATAPSSTCPPLANTSANVGFIYELQKKDSRSTFHQRK